MKLIGPFSQILPLKGLPEKGAIVDEQLEVIVDGGVLISEGNIVAVGVFDSLCAQFPKAELVLMDSPAVLLPGFIDCHTHICFDGSRSKDYAMRIAGKSYLEIARSGGGIWDSVLKTRAASEQTLVENTIARANRHLQEGITTIEVKSGYGLDRISELNMLRAIQKASKHTQVSLIPTCLAAHIKPKDFSGTEIDYLNWIVAELLPTLKKENLTKRIDIFIEESAFSVPAAQQFLATAATEGFSITVHADQFTPGGSSVAVAVGALSADHLEASGEKEISLIANSDTVAVVLPGASLGLGMPYAPARKLLDAGACVAIASDWNPGSAPMGDLLLQASVMSAAEKLSTAEVLAALTYRAAKALHLLDRGQLSEGLLADMQAYPCDDYREILYHQGRMKPFRVWKGGEPL